MREVVNVDRLYTFLGLMQIMGAKRRIQENLFFYVELRWLAAGSTKITTSGTKKEPGKNYASDTAAAALLETVFPGSVAQALSSSSGDGGGRTANGLNLSYDRRVLFGLMYLLNRFCI